MSADDADVLRLTQGDLAGSNLYTYCNNNPIMLSDPTGLIAGVDDAAILLAVGLFLAGSALVTYICTPSFQCSWRNLCTSIGKAIAGAWDWLMAASANVTKTVYNTVSKAQTKIRNNYKRYDYWVAVKVTFKGGLSTYVPTIGISYSKAIAYVRAGGDVFANSKNNAYKLAKAVGGGGADRDPAHGTLGFWPHYHATRGGKRMGGHIFYV